MKGFKDMKVDRKKLAVLCGMLALVLCVTVVNNRLSVGQGLSASAGYTDYEENQIQKHDGQVLVDSVNVKSVAGKSAAESDGTKEKAKEKATETPAPTSPGSLVTSDNAADLENADTYFNEVRATINMDRNEIISMLTDVIAETKDGPEKNNATQQKLKIIDYMNKEKVVENLIENKGYPDVLVLMTDTSVNVTVNKQDLTQSDVAKICDIAMRETGRSADQIVIQSKF